MDSLRGSFIDSAEGDLGYGGYDDGYHDDDGRQLPPSIIGQDERRMQVRAYNHWAGLLDNRVFPSIEDLDPESLPDFGPYSVLLDFTGGIENPAIQYLGPQLAEECGAGAQIRKLDDVPSRSLLSRITDHYMQILANQAPIGFEAEFVNQRGKTILYRGILLPFSSNDETIDFIFGVINWKELADAQSADELLLEIDQALAAKPAVAGDSPALLSGWADGPADTSNVLDLVTPLDTGEDEALGWPAPAFGTDPVPVAEVVPVAYEPAPEEMELADWLASAREMAQAAKGSEDRTRQALYAAIGRAYDFSIAASEAPEDFDALLCDSGLTMQDRAPMTPVVKLVFGSDYDKTRLTEYATALSHAHRMNIARGSLAGFLAAAPGGLKGVVNAERRMKRAESGRIDTRETPHDALVRKLRQLDHQALGSVAAEGSEFTVLVARRLASGEVVLLGEVGDDPALLERAAKRLVG